MFATRKVSAVTLSCRLHSAAPLNSLPGGGLPPCLTRSACWQSAPCAAASRAAPQLRVLRATGYSVETPQGCSTGTRAAQLAACAFCWHSAPTLARSHIFGPHAQAQRVAAEQAHLQRPCACAERVCVARASPLHLRVRLSPRQIGTLSRGPSSYAFAHVRRGLLTSAAAGGAPWSSIPRISAAEGARPCLSV